MRSRISNYRDHSCSVQLDSSDNPAVTRNRRLDSSGTSRRSATSSFLPLRGRRQRYGSLGGEKKERECLLQVQANGGIGVAEITDGDVLTDVQVEIAATRSQHECAGNGGRPNDLIFNQPFNVLQHRISMVASLGECGVGVGPEKH